MIEMIGNTEKDERGLLPYPVIIAATKGDPEAMKIVVQQYESSHSHPVYAKAPRRARQYLLRHRRGHTRPLAVKAYAGCPFIQGLS